MPSKNTPRTPGWRGYLPGLLRAWALTLFGLAGGAPSDVWADTLDAPQPNVLLIMTDDQGYGDVASHGNPIIKTPRQDQLAAEGARLDHFFVSPVCAPTRASLLTGRYSLRTGVHGVTRGYENMRSEEITLAEVLQPAGYATGCFGKWHNGRHAPNHPNGQGFEEFIGFCGGHWNTYFDAPLQHNGSKFTSQGYIADAITDAALAFMKREQGKRPWFCYVAYNTPHSPWRMPDKYWEMYDGLQLDAKAHSAYAMVSNLDWNLGRLLDALEGLNATRDTVVIFLSDNGANSDRYNAGMKGRKASVDEGGTRVPCFIRWPGRIKAGTRIQPIAFHLDILPTLGELCHVELDEGHRSRLDGRSLVPLLMPSSDTNWPDRVFFTDRFRWGQRIENIRGAVRTERWRATRSNRRWQLYDMRQDPGQTQDVASQFPDVVVSLAAQFDTWLADVTQAPLEWPPIPITRTKRPIELPANEATLYPAPGEGIQYSGDTGAGYANCWIHNWTSQEAFPRWYVDVQDPGIYRVKLFYTCRREDVGNQLSVEIGKQRRLVTVPRFHDPPLVNKPDHVYSTNYQDKTNWLPLDAGSFRLEPGTQFFEIKLHRVERPTPNSEALDLLRVEISS